MFVATVLEMRLDFNFAAELVCDAAGVQLLLEQHLR